MTPVAEGTDGSEREAGSYAGTRIVREPVSRSEVERLAREGFGDMVKAVVDVERAIMALAGELHSDQEALLLDDGSRQDDLWGINLYPGRPPDEWLEYDSMINLRPSQGNRSRDVENADTRNRIRKIVDDLIAD